MATAGEEVCGPGWADGQLDPLVAETHQASDPCSGGNRRLVAPHEILVDGAAGLDRSVQRLAVNGQVARRAEGSGTSARTSSAGMW